MLLPLHLFALALAAQPSAPPEDCLDRAPTALAAAEIQDPVVKSKGRKVRKGAGTGQRTEKATGSSKAKRGKKGSRRGTNRPEPAPPAPTGSEERVELPPLEDPIGGRMAGAPAPPVAGDLHNLPGDRVPDECDGCESDAWALDARRGSGGVTGRDVPSGGSAGAGGGGSSSPAGAPDSSGALGSSAGGGAAGTTGGGLSGRGGASGTGASGVGSTMAMASGGDEVTVRLDRHFPPAGAAVKGCRNQGGIHQLQDQFAGLNDSGGMLRVNVRMNHLGELPWAAWQMQWAQESGMEVLMTVFGGTGGASAPGGGGSGSPGGQLDPSSSVPADLAGWSMSVVAMLGEVRRMTGSLPDHLEIWNEPDRPEFFSGTIQNYLAIYSALAPRVRAQYPQIGIGGMGLAGSESDMGTGDSALFSLIDHAAEHGLPLDFLSWHNYGIGASMRYTRIPERLDAALAAHGMAADLFVTEWNVRATTARNSHEFDTSSSAANMVTFLSSAVGQGVDGNAFFMLWDTDDQEGIADLTGKALGAMTARALKKPVWRTMELVYPMADETRFGVQVPDNEYALGLLATWDGNRARVALANDAVEPEWVWTRGCREIGMEPGETAILVRDAGGTTTSPPERAALIAEGLTPAEADAVLAVIDRVAEAADLRVRSRTVVLTLSGSSQPSVLRAWRFDSSHNAPAAHLETLFPHLEQVERDAQAAAEAAAAAKVAEFGGSVPPNLSWTGSIEALAAALGITVEEVKVVIAVYRTTLKMERVSQSEFLNSLPGAALVEESGAEAGVQINGNQLTVELEPNGVLILDINP